MCARKHLLWLVIVVSAVLVGLVFLVACGPQPDSGPEPVPTSAQPENTAVPPTVTPTPTPSPTPTPTPTPTPDPTFPMHTTHLSYGINADLYFREDFGVTAGEVMGYVDDLGVEWVRIQITWADIEPDKGQYSWGQLDDIVDAVGRHNRKLLVSIVRSPAWATTDGGHGMPADPNDLGDFLLAVATRYQNRIQGYEIWNEQNYAVENAGYVQGAGRYVELLKVAYLRVKEGDPLAMVLFGPLTPTGVNDPNIAIDDISYLRQAYEYNAGEVKGYFDVLAGHVGGTHNPPDTLWPENPGPFPNWVDHPTHYFRHLENIRAVMEAYGDADKQLWLTEFGWASLDGISTDAATGYEYAENNSAAAQADYLVWALHLIRENYQPWLGNAVIWNLNFSTFNVANDEKSAFSLLRPDWGTRPSYRAVQHYLTEYSNWP